MVKFREVAEAIPVVFAMVNLAWAGFAIDKAKEYEDLIREAVNDNSKSDARSIQKYVYPSLAICTFIAFAAWKATTDNTEDEGISKLGLVAKLGLLLIGVHYAGTAYLMMQCDATTEKQEGARGDDPHDALEALSAPRPVRVMIYMLLGILALRYTLPSATARRRLTRNVQTKVKNVQTSVDQWKQKRRQMAQEIAKVRKDGADSAESRYWTDRSVRV